MEERSQSPSADRRPSGSASAAQSKMLWRYIRCDLAWACGTVTLTCLLVILLLRLWRADLHAPFLYQRDALVNLMIIKGVLQHSWWLENPDLGAPFGQELYDFPVMVGDSLHLALIKLLGVFSSDPFLILNLFFLLSFPLVALVSFLVLRQLGISAAVALVCSVLYALAPYHFFRSENHLFLSAYYSVPIGAYLVLSLLSGRPLFTRRASTGGPRLLAWASKRSLVTLILCLLVACAGTVYYAVFTGMLLIAVMVLILVTRRDIRTLIQGSIVLGVIVGFLLLSSLPNLMYELENGPNDEVAVRPVDESEALGLRFILMVFSQGEYQSLGLIATVGFLWLLLVAL